MTTAKHIEKLTYCGALVHEHDPDRFLLSLLMPPGHREALWALYAFNHEIAKTREVVSETQLGLIRLQWWREAIDGIYRGGEVPGHEILHALAAAIEAHDLPQELFEKLIYAREFDLEDAVPETLQGMVNYADFTSTPLVHLSLMVLGHDENEQVVRQAAIDYALIGLLRAVPFHAGQRRCYLPADLLAQNGMTPGRLYEGREPEAVAPVVSEVLRYMEGNDPRTPDTGGLINKTKRIVTLYKKQLHRCGENPFHPGMLRKPAFFHFRLVTGL